MTGQPDGDRGWEGTDTAHVPPLLTTRMIPDGVIGQIRQVAFTNSISVTGLSCGVCEGKIYHVVSGNVKLRGNEFPGDGDREVSVFKWHD